MLADLGCVGHVLLERLAQLRRLQPCVVGTATARNSPRTAAPHAVRAVRGASVRPCNARVRVLWACALGRGAASSKRDGISSSASLTY
eukprot:scaffold66750_cov56-Phaeocystis_antarctica.AAC.1